MARLQKLASNRVTLSRPSLVWALARRNAKMPPSTKVDLQILNKGSSQTVAVTLGTIPSSEEVAQLGLSLAPVSIVKGAAESASPPMASKPRRWAQQIYPPSVPLWAPCFIPLRQGHVGEAPGHQYSA
jgi:hypothetical protein